MGGDLVSEIAPASLPGYRSTRRTLEVPGELYVAIRGERFDGADFSAAALAAGAGGIGWCIEGGDGI